MEKKYCVYKHTAPNGKVYIGQTQNTAMERWANGKGYTCHKHGWFWKAIEKYGWDNIKHEILYDNLTKEAADYYEQFFIAMYQSADRRYGYNCQSGGSRNYTYSEESKKKISDGLKKHYAIYGNPSAKKARESLLKRIGRPVVQYDLHGNRIAEYKSAYDAYLLTGINNGGINNCVTKRIKQTGGFMWRYLEDAPDKLEPYIQKHACCQYDLDGNLIKIWDDVKEADKYFYPKKKRCTIEKCCDGIGYKTAYGFQWKYLEDANNKIDKHNSFKKVLQYDSNGNFIKVWHSRMAIKKELGWDVSAACRGESKTSFGYQWRYEGDVRQVSVVEKPHVVKKKISQYSKDGILLNVFNTTRQASEITGINYSNIMTCVSGRNKTAGGYIWEYSQT